MAPYEGLPEPWRLSQAPRELRQMLTRSKGELGRGAFSIVLALDNTSVLKLTTCEASSVILPKLVRNPTPGLPLVYRDFGQVGVVEGVEGHYEDIPVCAYVMERLVSIWELDWLRDGPCPRGDAMRASTVEQAKQNYSWVADKAIRAHEQWKDGRATFEQGITEAFANTPFRPLAQVTKRLSARVQRQEWRYDWARRFDSNVLLSRWGEPILSDPVFALNQPFWKQGYPGLCEDTYDYN